MATIVLNNGMLLIGNDFIDATLNCNKGKSHGTITTECYGLKVNRKWTSTLPITESEKVLRKAASNDGVRVTYFQSQSI